MFDSEIQSEPRRQFLKKFIWMGGIGAAGSAPVHAAIQWLREEAPPGNGDFLSVSPDPTERPFRPLERIVLESSQPGTVLLFDGNNREFLRREWQGDPLEVPVGGGPGNQLILLLDRKSRPVDFATLRMECRTSVGDGSGRFSTLLDHLYFTMTNEWEREAGVVRYNGKFYHQFVGWIRDHVHTLKGMKYFYPVLKSGIDLYADSQREDGMIWDNYNKRPEEGDYWEQRFDYGGFVRVADQGTREFRRIPVENDVEYLFIEGLYYTWKATGDDRWMKGHLDRALKALEYSMSDPYRWSEKYRLLKRGYTIDTWDFQNDEDAGISAGPDHMADPMVIRLPYTRFGIMFGDNTGMSAGCRYLAEMLDLAGREEEAVRVRSIGEGIMERLDALSWNGSFYTHHVPEDETVERDLGVDEKSQVSLSNAYSINRLLPHDHVVSVIRTYQGIQERMPDTSPGEWYTIYPPFGKGFGSHNTLWSYMNGGVTTIVAGELAHGAFEHGFEEYGVEILERLLKLSERSHGYLHCTYRGAMEPPPERTFRSVSLTGVANTDFTGNTVEGVAGWTGEGENDLHEFPTGHQVFDEIPFEVIDPAENGRKACLGLSGAAPYAQEAGLEVDAMAGSIYLLHATGRSYYAGSLHVEYEDGTSVVDHIGPGKISNWWYPTAPQDRKQTPVMRVAWRGANRMSRNVGVCLYGYNHPHPEKRIKTLRFSSAGDSGKWMVLGVTLSDHPVWFRPDPISAGIPDNWGAAAVVYALVEGLCGVRDLGKAFERVRVSPRWEAAGEAEANVNIAYPASNGYVSYRYRKGPESISLEMTGSSASFDLSLLLPGGSEVVAVELNGVQVPYEIDRVERSYYLNIDGIPAGVNDLEIALKPAS
ncbi:MAG: hypothetical protein ACWGNV_09185 [Bacteroidales bacterium]